MYPDPDASQRLTKDRAYNRGRMIHRFVLHNGHLRDASERCLSPGQVGLLNGWGVFSTLQVKDGVLFAWERHYARMKKDAELMGVPFPSDSEWMRQELVRLVHANTAWNATLRVAVIRNHGGQFDGPGIDRDFDLVAFTKELTDWGGSVRLALEPNGRFAKNRFSGAKILSWAANLTYLEQARARGFDEVLLLDEDGHISECTSANIFLARGDVVWTPPLSCGCLPGVTRELLLEEIHVPGLEVLQKQLEPKDLEAADEVFITSSTRNLLPVSEVEGRRLRQQGRAREQLNAAFHRYMDAYVDQAKSQYSKALPSLISPAGFQRRTRI